MKTITKNDLDKLRKKAKTRPHKYNVGAKADQTLTPWCRVPTAALERALKLLEPQKAATG